MNVLVVDDETNARENIITRLKNLDVELNIIGEASNVSEAREIIDTRSVDIVFLDIEMPGENGFELLKDYNELPFSVVFVTAYNEYAIEAFEHLAQGYLLKPIDNSLLNKVVNKIISNNNNYSDNTILKKLDSLLRESENPRIGIPTEKGMEIINYEDILYLEADSGYSIIYLTDGKIVSSKRLVYFEENLSKRSFIRIHRKYIANTNAIKRYLRSGEITLNNDTKLPVNKASRQRIKDVFL